MLTTSGNSPEQTQSNVDTFVGDESPTTSTSLINIKDTASAKARKSEISSKREDIRSILARSDSMLKNNDSATIDVTDSHRKETRIELAYFLRYLLSMFTLKIAIRLLSLLIVVYQLYYSISFWWNEEGNRENINIQLSLTTSVFAFYASCAFGDYLHTVASNVEKVLKTNNDLIGDDKENAKEICRFGLYTKFMFFVNAGGGALVILLSHINVDGAPNSTWAQELMTPIAWIVCWTIGYFMLHAIAVDVLAFQNKDFVDFVRTKTVPICGGMAAVQLFAIMACLFQGEMARNDPYLEITSSWSSGQGCINVQYIILMMESLAVYCYGAGHIKFGKDDEQNFQEGINKTWVQLGLTFIKQSFLGGGVCLIISIGALFTTFDSSKYLVFVYLLVLFYTLVGIAVVLTRAESPARLGALLKRYDKKYHAFISHAQGPGGDQVECIARQLKILGFNIWRDIEKVDLTDDKKRELMKKGIDESLFVIVFLTRDEKDPTKDENDKTGSSLIRPFPRMEVQHAINEGYADKKRMIFVMETDERHFGFGSDVKFLIEELSRRHPADHPELPCGLVYNTGDYKGFKDIIQGTDIMMYERRATYSDAFYSQLTKRLSQQTSAIQAKFDFDFYISYPRKSGEGGEEMARSIKDLLSEKKHKVCDFSMMPPSGAEIESSIDKSEHVVIVITFESLKDPSVIYSLTYLNIKKRNAFLVMDVNVERSKGVPPYGFDNAKDFHVFSQFHESELQYLINQAGRQIDYKRGDKKKALLEEFYTELIAAVKKK